MSLSFTSGSIRFLFQPRVYYKHKFITNIFKNDALGNFLFLKSTPVTHTRKDPLCRLSGKIKEHIQEEIIPTRTTPHPRKMHPAVCFSRGKCICNRCSVPCTAVSATFCLSHSHETLECFSKTCTKFQINTLSPKLKVVDIYSNAGSSIFTYIMNCQPQALVSTHTKKPS